MTHQMKKRSRRKGYLERLNLLLDYLQRKENLQRGLTVKELAKKIGVTERTIRDYISELYNLQIVTKTSDRRIKIRFDLLDEAKRIISIPLDDSEQQTYQLEDDTQSTVTIFDKKAKQLSLEDFLVISEAKDPTGPVAYGLKTLKDIENDQIINLYEFKSKRIAEILSKMNAPLIEWSKIKDFLVSSDMPNNSEEITLLGDQLIYRRLAMASNTYPSTLIGLSTLSEGRVWWIRDVLALFPIILSTVADVVKFDGNIVVGGHQKVRAPSFDFIADDMLPLRELLTEFGGSFEISVRMAARLLSYAQMYRLGQRLLENQDEPAKYIFINGVILLHGFYMKDPSTGDSAYRKLAREVTDSFSGFIRAAREHQTRIIGVSLGSRDRSFSKTILDSLGVTSGPINDAVFLSRVISERDASCLIQRTERSKAFVPDSYEFYLNLKGQITKLEFLTLNRNQDPLELHEEIASLVYSSSYPSPIQAGMYQQDLATFGSPFMNNEFLNKDISSIFLPMVVSEALMEARIWLEILYNLASEAAEAMTTQIIKGLKKTTLWY